MPMAMPTGVVMANGRASISFLDMVSAVQLRFVSEDVVWFSSPLASSLLCSALGAAMTD